MAHLIYANLWHLCFWFFGWASEPGFGVEIGHGPSGLDTSSGTRVRCSECIGVPERWI